MLMSRYFLNIPAFPREAWVRFAPRLCENASEPRTLRIVFSIALCQQHLPVRLVSAATKSRWKFSAQVQRLSFHKACARSGPSSNVCFDPDWTCVLRLPSLSARLIRQDSCHNRLGTALAQYGAKWNPSWVSAGSNGQQQAEGATM